MLKTLFIHQLNEVVILRVPLDLAVNFHLKPRTQLRGFATGAHNNRQNNRTIIVV
jgi:hypothetical protein